jgi:hypothetical protein
MIDASMTNMLAVKKNKTIEVLFNSMMQLSILVCWTAHFMTLR